MTTIDHIFYGIYPNTEFAVLIYIFKTIPTTLTELNKNRNYKLFKSMSERMYVEIVECLK